MLRWRGWRPALWVLATVGVVVDWVITYAVGLVLLLAHAGVCSEPSTTEHLQAAQRGFLVLCAVLATPWLIAGIRSRHRLRVAVLGAAGLALAIVWTAQTLRDTPAEFTTTWCVF